MIYVVPPIKNPVISPFADKTPENAPDMLATLIAGLVGLILTIATIWSFVQLLIGGLNWISSGGDKSALEGARQRITNAIIGLFIVFAAWGIFLLVLQFFGISGAEKGGGFNLKLPTLF